MEFEPIGYLKSSFVDKFGTPRQPGLAAHSRAELKIRADLQPEIALQGLEGFSHVWIIFVFHKNETARYHAKVHPPRLGGESMGLFATRTPHRPNPLGLSLVEVIKVDKDTVTLGGVDLIDGTPVLDIKPYLPAIESKPEARVGWTGEVANPNIKIEFTEEAESTLQSWQKQIAVNLKDHIQEVLSLDPRPNVYKGYEGQKGPYRQEHRVRLFDGDVHFEFMTPELVKVHRIVWPFKGPEPTGS